MPRTRSRDPGRARRAQANIALVLGGGMGLGAYQAGALEEAARRGLEPDWLAGSSVGAINAALFAGNPPELRGERLASFWRGLARPNWLWAAPTRGLLREAHHALSALQTRIFGLPGGFVPAILSGRFEPALYDPAPLRRRLEALIDFERLNQGPIRLSVMTTDVEAGSPIIFDTARGRIGPEHLLASAAFIGDFPPVRLDGHLLGDGGLVANTPLDAVLQDWTGPDLVCFAIDLFCRSGRAPSSVLEALDRRTTLLFAAQTRRMIDQYREAYALRYLLHRTTAAGDLPDEALRRAVRDQASDRAVVLYLTAYRPEPEETIMRGFDFSRSTVERRWHVGGADMGRALDAFAATTVRYPQGFTVVEP